MKHYLMSFITTAHEGIAKKIGEFFGARGNDSDLIFYDSIDDDQNVYITIAPQGYPDKLKTLIQCLAIGDFHILLVTPDDKMDALMGEMIVALEMHPEGIPLVVLGGITKLNEYLVDDLKAKLMKIINNTTLKDRVKDIIVLHDYETDLPKFKAHIMELAADIPEKKTGNVRILIDAVFPVKGVGTVILGVVKSGTFNANEMLEMTDPSGTFKNVIAKSIQMQDIDQKSATQGDRVGVAVKGLKPEEISRDNMLVTKGSMEAHDEIGVKFRLSKFVKKPIDIKDKQLYHIAIDHQVFGAVPTTIEGGSEAGILKPNEEGLVTFKCEKKFSFNSENNWGIVTILEKFNGKLRILGCGRVQA
jgi:selenocysteine-specific translation elongation factor